MQYTLNVNRIYGESNEARYCGCDDDDDNDEDEEMKSI